MQAKSGQINNGVTMNVFYANPMAGYAITKSSQLNYNGAGGYGGWSAPSGGVVSGGGYEFLTNIASQPGFALLSALALEHSIWPHYTFGANEQGWVVQGPNNNSSPNPGHVYVVSFDQPVPVPLPAGLPLLGGALALLGWLGWRRKSAVTA
jgi:hypothetical protein